MDKPNSKTSARDFAFRYLFQLQTIEGKERLTQSANSRLEIEKSINDFALVYAEKDDENLGAIIDKEALFFGQKLIVGVIKQYDQLFQKVSDTLNRKIESVDKVDLTILILGSFELIFVKETPAKVVLNEYIELSKKFGRAESSSFINGILDSIMRNNA